MRTATSIKPRPSQEAVPAESPAPDNCNPAPMRPTMLWRSHQRQYPSSVFTYPRMRSDRTRDWTIRIRVVDGRPRHSSHEVDPRIINAPAIVSTCKLSRMGQLARRTTMYRRTRLREVDVPGW
jgi:hypothetical protein